MKTVILANGEFPRYKIPLALLNNAEQIISCDGAANNLVQYGLRPSLIIGDMDSLNIEIKRKFSDVLKIIPDQNTNDLTKAVNWCIKKGIPEVVILGATGKREDHSIGNISLLAEYVGKIKLKMITDYGEFTPIIKSSFFNSFKGQQVSVFSMNPQIKINSVNLKYPLIKLKLDAWWKGSLNESTANQFSINFNRGKVIVYQLFDSR